MPRRAPRARELADRLHSAAIHLLRRFRSEDTAAGLTAPKGSAMSVLVFGGPTTLTRLATVEQVRPPTMSRLIAQLERARLVTRAQDKTDGRVQWIAATSQGRRALEKGRARRVARLEADLGALRGTELQQLDRAIPIIERIARTITKP